MKKILIGAILASSLTMANQIDEMQCQRSAASLTKYGNYTLEYAKIKDFDMAKMYAKMFQESAIDFKILCRFMIKTKEGKDAYNGGIKSNNNFIKALKIKKLL